ncbi:MAG: DegT/DnrJ/EryC1/StrS family aminotransferase [Chloroflexi bacterium]|nr:MAG: DegT/DnrJ/EryC1/StrS family aminotransferase [Chloroflexota bacterium]MBL1193191.1 DegT/DnrJ/EryC1/StrS family aminotransferase [Chloroflexota bacterium]NOH10485.1 DegT/DnrJ/EryC1/StrS family aminotransferase [Chloroflexota bacterium]
MSTESEFIPIMKPWMGEAEAEATRRPLLSGWVTQGPEVAAFETEFAGYTGAQHAVAVSNCTTALHLALLAVGMQPGDEVITVSHSFIASANSIVYCDAVPVFVDIDPHTYNIDPNLIEAAITEKTAAILCVHQIGMPCDMQAILDIAYKHDLPVVEDAACAIGSEIQFNGEWHKVGQAHGDIVCLSFHPRKVMTTGDGGMLTTNNPEYDKEFRLLRQHGMSVPDTKRHTAKEVIFEEYTQLGYNYRMTDVQAAIGREQLKRLPEMVEKRRYFAHRYEEALSEIDGLLTPQEPDWARSNWQSYSVRLPQNCDQKAVMQYMLDHNIATRRGIMNAHSEPAYQHIEWRKAGNLQHSEAAQQECILLPLFHEMTEEQQDRVVDNLAAAIKENAA